MQYDSAAALLNALCRGRKVWVTQCRRQVVAMMERRGLVKAGMTRVRLSPNARLLRDAILDATDTRPDALAPRASPGARRHWRVETGAWSMPERFDGADEIG